MNFIGQNSILKELDIIIKLAQENLEFSINLLFRAPSRYGKTNLALRIASLLGNWEYINVDENKIFPIDRKKRLHIIDEIHVLTTPEFLYPIMDLHKYIFIFCSNESGELKEPLINRCIQFIFEPYTLEEIIIIISNIFQGKLAPELIHEIATNCQNNPGIATLISQRLMNLFMVLGYPQTLKDLQYYLVNYLNVRNGLNELHNRYLNFLRGIGRASLDLISYGTHLDKATIKRDIEPYLISRNMVKITSKGREIM
jgi:Holliday junction resolvasome RuvABC ATP-dependent DNA helicase subunit